MLEFIIIVLLLIPNMKYIKLVVLKVILVQTFGVLGFALVTFIECTAHFNHPCISQHADIIHYFYEIRQKLWGKSLNILVFVLVFPSFILSQSKPGIPFTSGQKGILHLQTAPH